MIVALHKKVRLREKNSRDSESSLESIRDGSAGRTPRFPVVLEMPTVGFRAPERSYTVYVILPDLSEIDQQVIQVIVQVHSIVLACNNVLMDC